MMPCAAVAGCHVMLTTILTGVSVPMSALRDDAHRPMSMVMHCKSS